MKNEFINALKKNLENDINHSLDVAFIQLDKDNILYSITYGEFYKEVCKKGKKLVESGYSNMTVILYMSNSIDSIINLFACFYANVKPIIKSYNTNNIELDKYYEEIETLISNFDNIKYVFLDNFLFEKISNKLTFDNILNMDNIVENSYLFNNLNEEYDFILSTSGSTAIPKCVKISIKKLFANVLFDMNLWNVDNESKFLNWLPISHIYGLCSIVFIPLYFKATSYLMKPHDYYSDCYLWIKAISKFKITHTSIINFALNQLAMVYDDNDSIDLSHIQNISIGGESVKLSSVRNFYNKYKKFKLDYNVFSPSYGMSENSGLVSEYKSNFGRPLSIKVNRKNLIEGRMKEDKNGVEIVNLGFVDKANVLIFDEKNNNYFLVDDMIGEVVLNKKSLCLGYLGQVQKFSDYFHTGDLGLIHDNCLYLCGRIKDIIVIRGKNFASSLICDAISNTLTNYKIGINTFINIPNNDDNIYFAQEILGSLEDALNLKLKIRFLINSYTKYDIPLKNIILIESEKLPKLSSGKLDKIKLTNLIIDGVLK